MFDNVGRSIKWRFTPKTDNSWAVRFSLAEETKSAEEDAFLWSMADLMTLLLVFFVLLYANAINRPEVTVQASEQESATISASSGFHSDLPPDRYPAESTLTDEKVAPISDSPAAKLKASEAEVSVEPLNQAMMNRLKDSFNKDFSSHRT